MDSSEKLYKNESYPMKEKKNFSSIIKDGLYPKPFVRISHATTIGKYQMALQFEQLALN